MNEGHIKFMKQMSGLYSEIQSPEDEQAMYQATINEVALLVHTTLRDQGDLDRLQAELMNIKEVLELVGDIFKYPMYKIENDMLDAVETLPLEDMAQAQRLKRQGMLN